LTEPDALSFRQHLTAGKSMPESERLLNFVAEDQSVHSLVCHVAVEREGFTLIGGIPREESGLFSLNYWN
jgi:hypothetical protein